MLIYKLLGSGFLLACGILYPCLCARERRTALVQIETLMELVGFIKRQIEYFRLPMREILARCDASVLRECGYPADVSPKSFSAMLEASSFCDGECERIAHAFAEGFGRGYREEETRGCEYYLAQLQAYKETLSKKLPAQKKMNATLSICAALALVLLLL